CTTPHSVRAGTTCTARSGSPTPSIAGSRPRSAPATSCSGPARSTARSTSWPCCDEAAPLSRAAGPRPTALAALVRARGAARLVRGARALLPGPADPPAGRLLGEPGRPVAARAADRAGRDPRRLSAPLLLALPAAQGLALRAPAHQALADGRLGSARLRGRVRLRARLHRHPERHRDERRHD